MSTTKDEEDKEDVEIRDCKKCSAHASNAPQLAYASPRTSLQSPLGEILPAQLQGQVFTSFIHEPTARAARHDFHGIEKLPAFLQWAFASLDARNQLWLEV